jgi:hypothetical protein
MAKRTDSNQKEIVKAFRQLGASVQILSDVGKGCPDLLIGMCARNFLVEVKDGKKPPSGQRLTEHEQDFFDSWHGQVCIIRSIEDVHSFVQNVICPSVFST